MDKSDLGKVARDKVTGFTGTLIGIASYITGCDQYLVQPITKETGEHQEGRWIDEGRLELTQDQSTGVDPKTLGAEKPGADIAAPIK